MFGKIFQKKAKKAENLIRYGRPLDPDTDGMEVVETRKNLFAYCAESMVNYSDGAGLCDCCSRKVDKFIICEPKWDGWERYRKQQGDTPIKSDITDADKNFELHLCSECIASGNALQKFGIKFFNLPAYISDDQKIKGYDEVKYRTPDHVSCTDNIAKTIPFHCDEACELVASFDGGEAITEELSGMILPYSDSVLKSYETEDFASMHENAKKTFVFKCKQCGQHMAVFYSENAD